MNDCYDCKSKKSVLGSCHIECINPDKDMTGNEYGIKNGWFIYPALFDPTWMTKKCNNFEEK